MKSLSVIIIPVEFIELYFSLSKMLCALEPLGGDLIFP